MDGTVLVVTATDDHTADLVVSELLARDVPVVRLDPGAQFIEMNTFLATGGWRNTITDGHRAVRLEEVTAVLWRWPTSPAGHPAVSDRDRRAWAAREDTAALYGVLRTLPVRWINHPDRAAAADFKPGQLVTATQCGFTVPDTLITTSGHHARRWAGQRAVLYKAFHAQGVDDGQMVLATPVQPEAIPPELCAASMFQQVINGQHARMTAVGAGSDTALFTVIISGAGRTDWRAAPDVVYTPVDVPPQVRERIGRYLDRTGLEYGAFDFVINPAGDWVFLECNPLGMYGFVEITAGLPITTAIADRLCEHIGSGARPRRTVGS